MGPPLALPTALTPDVQGKILDRLAEGNYLKVACAASGITYRSFWHWRRRWAGGDPVAVGRFDAFFRAVDQAVATGESNALAAVLRGKPGWQASALFLGRRFPERWGRKDRNRRPPRPPRDLGTMTDREFELYRAKVESIKS